MVSTELTDIKAFQKEISKAMHELPNRQTPQEEWTNPIKTYKQFLKVVPKIREGIQRVAVFAIQTRTKMDELWERVNMTLAAIKKEAEK